ncbi:MAG: anhydro-N-acetylmuramic acid kinase, partial [Planctomycetota bacterium]
MSGRIRKTAGKGTIRVAGLMSGTSADGVDVAIVDSAGRKVQLQAFEMFPYPPALHREILRLFRPESARLDNICHYNFVLGEVFADSIIRLCSNSRISLSSIDV